MVLQSVFYRIPDEAFAKIMEQFQQVCNQEETYLRVVMRTDDFHDAVRGVEEIDGVLMLVIGVEDLHSQTGQQALQLGRMAAYKNRDNYVIYSALDSKIMIQMAPFCTHPAGVLTNAMLETRGGRLLRDILRDYNTLYHDEEEGQWISLKVKGSVTRVNMNDICAVMAANKMVEVTTLKEKLLVYDTLDNIGSKLDERFIRCHRSCLINIKRIQRVDFPQMSIVLMNGTEVPLARSFKQAIHGLFKQEENKEKEGDA